MGRRRKHMIVLYARHFCKRCDQRVFPYDTFEKRTESPRPGVRSGRVLLFSENSRRARIDPDDPSRVAWCWNCDRWTDTYRETLADIWRRYEERDGVRYRRAKILPMKRRRRTA